MTTSTAPEGWKLVPIEPTEDMVVDGFESSPDPVFSKPEDWQAFEEMTGCQQAAHKARLCYAAMLAASPTAPAQPCGEDSVPLNGIRATFRHDEGAIARCSYCGRYSLDPKTLSARQPKCECGEKHGWSGSFEKPGPNAKWSGAAPSAPQPIGEDAAKSAQKFAGMVLKAHRNDGYPGDVDGGFLHQAALDCGLIEERTATEACGEGCTCAEVADFPMQCYFNTDSGRAAIAQAEVKT